MKRLNVFGLVGLLSFGGCQANDAPNNSGEKPRLVYDLVETGMPAARVLELMGPCDFYFPGDFIRGRVDVEDRGILCRRLG